MKKRLIKFLFKYVILGRKLDQSIAEVVKEIRKNQFPTDEELGHLFGAIITRITRSWIFGLIITLAPTIITILLLFRQNTILERQTDFFERSYKVQNLRTNTNLIHESHNSRALVEIAFRDVITYLKNEYGGDPNYRFQFASAKLYQINLLGLDLSQANFESANFAQSTMSDQKITNSSFKSAHFGITRLTGTHFIKCDFRNATFGSGVATSNLRPEDPIPKNYFLEVPYDKGLMNDMTFEQCNLTGVNWSTRDLSGTNFIDCVWDTTALSKGLVYGAMFIDVKGLPEEVRNKLSRSMAITSIEELRNFIERIKKQQRLQAYQGYPFQLNRLVEHYEEILDRLTE